MMDVPKTLVIGIYMHGILPLDKNGEMQMQKVPKGLNVTTINSVAPGITNISNIEAIETIAKQLSSKIKTKKNYNKLTKTQITKITENIRDLLVEENKQHAFNIIKEYHYSYSKYKVNNDFQHFAYQYDNSFRIKTYDTYSSIPNKLFIKFTNGEQSNPNNFHEHYFNKIILYNLQELDLFEMLETSGLTIEHISMENLMEYFVSLGVQNLIIVDLSCSTFNVDYKISDRHIRQVRRHML